MADGDRDGCGIFWCWYLAKLIGLISTNKLKAKQCLQCKEETIFWFDGLENLDLNFPGTWVMC